MDRWAEVVVGCALFAVLTWAVVYWIDDTITWRDDSAEHYQKMIDVLRETQ